MFFKYHPEGSEEPTLWPYNPKRLMSAEREMLERRTDRNFTQFVIDVYQGSSLCRRALLWLYLKRTDARIKFDDVDFAWDEVDFVMSRAELVEMRAEVSEKAPAGQRELMLAKLDEDIADAPEVPPEGKAQPPSAG